MDRPRSKLAIVLVLLPAIIAAWLLLRRSHRAPADEVRAPKPAETARPGRPQTLQLPTATISPGDTPQAAAGFGGRVVSAETGQPVAHASLTFVLASAAVAASSDDDGRFVVRSDAPGSYELVSATAEGFLPFDAQGGSGAVLVSTRPDAHIDDVMIYLTPAVKLMVVVQDPSNKPLAGARVTMLNGRGLASAEPRATDERGQVELVGEPEQRIDVRRTGFLRNSAAFSRTMRQRRLVVTLQPGQDPALLAISGRAIDSAGAPVEAAVVEAYSMTPGVARRSAVALTGADGGFVLPELGEDRYRVRATTQHQGCGELQNIAGGARGVELRLGPPEIGIRGTVHDAANRPVPAFAVIATPRDGPLIRGAPLRASVIDPLGRYFFALPPGSYAVVVVARGHAPSAETAVEVTTGIVDVDVTLASGSRMFGKVVERDTGAPIAGAYINLAIASAAEGVSFVNAATSGNDGAFSFDGLRPGRTSITVQASGHNGRVVPGLEVPPDRPLGPVTVDLAKAVQGQEMFEFAGIAASLDPAATGLRISGVIPGGGAADAGLHVGDTIVAVDGRAVVELGTTTAVEALRGPENTIVALTIKGADGATAIIPVTRKKVQVR
jgi:hypothetical protein